VLFALGVLVAAFGLLTARVLREGERELRTAEALAAAGNLDEAIVHARRSASWYAPGAPHVPVAYAKLASIAQMAEGRGDAATALVAWRAVREAALSTRWIVVPHRDELAVANASIARLASKGNQPPGARVRDPDELQQQLHQMLAQERHPRAPWVVTLLAGFTAMTAGLVAMGLFGFTPKGEWNWKRMRVGAGAAVVGLVAWALALWNA
jgi:hypothetical protein